MTDERTGRELTPHDENQPSAPVPTPEQIERRALLGRRPHPHRGPHGGARGADRQAERQRPEHRVPGHSCCSPSSSPSTGSTPWACPRWASRARWPRPPTSSSSRTSSGATRCSSPTAPAATLGSNPGDGKGGVGPPLNDQAKLYNAINQQRRLGHRPPQPQLHPPGAGGRRPRTCAVTPTASCPSGLQPNGPLNYREVEELVTWITASSDVSFTYDPHSGHAVGVDPKATPYTVTGWRDPNCEPPPGAQPAAGLLAAVQQPGVPARRRHPTPHSRPSPTRARSTRRGPSRWT